jgi:hypothetical protein
MLVDEIFDVVVAAGEPELIKQGVEVAGRGIHIALPRCCPINENGRWPADRFYYAALFETYCLPLLSERVS